MQITLIAAVAENGVIGDDGGMPWHYPEDLAHFKSQTMGHPVVLGRVTFESIVTRLGGPLPGRQNVVLTESPERVEAFLSDSTETAVTDIENTTVTIASSVEDALQEARHFDTEEVFVAGGASIYEQFLPLADRLVLTEINNTYEGDTTFPTWDETEWTETAREKRDELSFVTYERRSEPDEQ